MAIAAEGGYFNTAKKRAVIKITVLSVCLVQPDYCNMNAKVGQAVRTSVVPVQSFFILLVQSQLFRREHSLMIFLAKA